MPVYIHFAQTDPEYTVANIMSSLVGVAILSVYMAWYSRTRKRMEKEGLHSASLRLPARTDPVGSAVDDIH
jgi:hypothetical protein